MPVQFTGPRVVQWDFMPQQFVPANPEIHQRTTGKIARDTEARSIFVAGVGTGGTITGVGKLLKSRKPSVQVVAVEPANSPVITQCRSGEELKPGKHTIQGIGAGFIPDVLDVKILDDVIRVPDDDAMETARRLAKVEGLMCGISSGAAAWAAIQIASREENAASSWSPSCPTWASAISRPACFPSSPRTNEGWRKTRAPRPRRHGWGGAGIEGIWIFMSGEESGSWMRTPGGPSGMSSLTPGAARPSSPSPCVSPPSGGDQLGASPGPPPAPVSSESLVAPFRTTASAAAMTQAPSNAGRGCSRRPHPWDLRHAG